MLVWWCSSVLICLQVGLPRAESRTDHGVFIERGVCSLAYRPCYDCLLWVWQASGQVQRREARTWSRPHPVKLIPLLPSGSPNLQECWFQRQWGGAPSPYRDSDRPVLPPGRSLGMGISSYESMIRCVKRSKRACQRSCALLPGSKMSTLPPDFSLHPQLAKIYEARKQVRGAARGLFEEDCGVVLLSLPRE